MYSQGKLVRGKGSWIEGEEGKQSCNLQQRPLEGSTGRMARGLRVSYVSKSAWLQASLQGFGAPAMPVIGQQSMLRSHKAVWGQWAHFSSNRCRCWLLQVKPLEGVWGALHTKVGREGSDGIWGPVTDMNSYC